jgi:hypothetical protein
MLSLMTTASTPWSLHNHSLPISNVPKVFYSLDVFSGKTFGTVYFAAHCTHVEHA